MLPTIQVVNEDETINQSEFDKIWPHLRVLARSSPLDKLTLVTGIQVCISLYVCAYIRTRQYLCLVHVCKNMPENVCLRMHTHIILQEYLPCSLISLLMSAGTCTKDKYPRVCAYVYTPTYIYRIAASLRLRQ